MAVTVVEARAMATTNQQKGREGAVAAAAGVAKVAAALGAAKVAAMVAMVAVPVDMVD